MKLTIISDTHNRHESLDLPGGEVLIHCGDMFDLFDESDDDFERMDEWFGQLDYDVILCTGGNHDFPLERRLTRTSNPFLNAVYLQDGSYEHGGVKFYGSPWTPRLQSHAFYGSPDELAKAWSSIPDDTDVLITHTPPASILDTSSSGLVLGCDMLRDAVQRITPRVHCFGHVHASRGQLLQGDIVYVNASSVSSKLDQVHPPFVMEI